MKLQRSFLMVLICSSISLKAYSITKLVGKGWNTHVRNKLEKLIEKKKGKGLSVVFDFDNTLICRDIGEATFAQLVTDKTIIKKNTLMNISPNFFLAGKIKSLNQIDTKNYDLTSYYEDFLSATKHHNKETTPYSNGYAWVVQIMSGMSPFSIIKASEKVFNKEVAKKDLNTSEETKIKTPASSYRRPYFYPEMVELVAAFLKNGYKVHVVSASNVWTVRYMVIKQLNQRLKAYGKNLSIKPENVIGVNTLIKDNRNGKLYKDQLLVRENSKYASMVSSELKNYQLTNQIVYPLSGYYGKVANIMKYIGTRPYLVAGDSPNDHPMLAYGKNQLWLARLEKTDYQSKTFNFVQSNKISKSWLVQPVLYKKYSGFYSGKSGPNKKYINSSNDSNTKNILKSRDILTSSKLLR